MMQLLKKIGIIIGLLTLNAVSQVTVGIIIRVTGSSSLMTILACLLVQFLVIGIFLYYAKRKELLSLNWRVWVTKKGVGTVLLSFLVLIAINMLGSVLLGLEGQTTTGNQEAVNQIVAQLPLPVTFVMVVIAAPVTEEIICRSLIPDLFPEKLILLGHLLGSLLFALMHMMAGWSIASFLLYAAMGSVFAFVYYRSKKLEYSILAHAVNNGFGFLLMLLSLLMSGS